MLGKWRRKILVLNNRFMFNLIGTIIVGHHDIVMFHAAQFIDKISASAEHILFVANFLILHTTLSCIHKPDNAVTNSNLWAMTVGN